MRCFWFRGRAEWQADEQISSVVVGLETGLGLAVIPHGLQDRRDPGVAAFAQFQLFQKFSDAAVTVTPRHRPAGPQLIHAD